MGIFSSSFLLHSHSSPTEKQSKLLLRNFSHVHFAFITWLVMSSTSSPKGSNRQSKWRGTSEFRTAVWRVEGLTMKMCLIVDFEANGEWVERKVWKRLIEELFSDTMCSKARECECGKKETPSRLFLFHSRLRKDEKFLRTKGNSIRKELKLIIFSLQCGKALQN